MARVEATAEALPYLVEADRLLARRRAAVQGSVASDAVALMRAAGMEPDPWQETVLRSESKRLLLNWGRQIGKSTVIAAIVTYGSLVETDALSLLLSPSERQSKELMRKVQQFYRRAGAAFMPTERDGIEEMELRNGSRIVALPGKEGTIRSYSGVRLLVIDEASRVPDALYYSVMPMLAVSDGSIYAMSTPFGKRGWWYDACAPHLEMPPRSNGWEYVEVPSTGCSRIAPAFLEEMHEKMGDWWFDQEFMCRFLDAQSAAFGTEFVNLAFAETVEQWVL